MQQLGSYLAMCTDDTHRLSLIASRFDFIDALIGDTSRYCRHDKDLIAHISEIFLGCTNPGKIEITEAYNAT